MAYRTIMARSHSAYSQRGSGQGGRLTAVPGTLRRIYVDEGLRGWYRGLTPTLFGYVPNWTIFFLAYHDFKTLYGNYFGSSMSQVQNNVLAAISAGAVNTVLTNPIWVVKTRIMTQSDKTLYNYTGMRHAFSSIVRQEGWRVLYRGLGSSLLGLTHVVVQFPLYEAIKRRLLQRERERSHDTAAELTSLHILAASAVSKICASVSTYPHEVVRTRLQTSPNHVNLGILGTARSIVRNESVKGLYRGMGTNLLRVVPSAATSFWAYELVVRTFDRLFPPQP